MLKKDMWPSFYSWYCEYYIPRKYWSVELPFPRCQVMGLFKRTKPPDQEEFASSLQWVDELRPVPRRQRCRGPREKGHLGAEAAGPVAREAAPTEEGRCTWEHRWGWRWEPGTGGANLFSRIFYILGKVGAEEALWWQPELGKIWG